MANDLYVNPINIGSEDYSGADIIAYQILMNEYKDWTRTYKPIELAALDMVSFNNPTILPAATSNAATAATNQFQSMRGVMERHNESLGLEATAQQKKTTDRIMKIRETEAVAGAKNAARSAVRSQDEQLLLGTSPNSNIVKPQGVTG